MNPKSLPLFGPPRAWRQEEFTASDDRVRGGSSQSFLSPSATLETARFHGVLDTTTLGGAGFASQRTVTTSTVWDLSAFSGIELDVARGDGKRYTLNLKTVLPHKMDNGRDASTLEYAFSFTASEKGSKIYATWADFKPFYRGKPVEDAEPLDTSKILRWSLMMRSFFEEQSGPFNLILRSIKARQHASHDSGLIHAEEDADWDDCRVDEKLPEPKTIANRKVDSIRFCSIL